MKDYTGVATTQLVRIWRKHSHYLDDDLVAVKARLHPRDFRKIVRSGRRVITGLGTADRILLAMGLHLAELTASGEVDVIPMQGRNAPRKMAEDEFWAKGITPSPEELDRRANELAELRDRILKKRS